MSSDGICKALSDERLVGEYRLALLAAGDNGGVVTVSTVARWANVSADRAEQIIEVLIGIGVFFRRGQGVFCQDFLPQQFPPHGKSGEIKKHVRRKVFARDGHRCRYCGTTDAKFQLDHVVPKSRGGPGTIENLVVSCSTCNQKKKNRTPDEMGWSL